MPAAGFSSFGGTSDPEVGMNYEFMADSDDLFHNTDPFDLGTSDTGILPTFDPLEFTSKPYPASAGAQAQTTPPELSPPSHRDSSSSGSSRRSAVSTSPKTSQTSGEVMMIDDGCLEAWKPADGLPNNDEVNYMLIDGLDSVNPSSHFDDNNFFDYESASSSPSPPTADGQSSLYPESNGNPHLMPGKMSSAHKARGHIKAQSQQSLAQSMIALQTHGSREVSPLFPSHESSPIAFNHSPSPENSGNYVNSASHGAYSNGPGWSSFSGQHLGGTQGRPDAASRPHGPPAYPIQNSLFNNGPRLVVQTSPVKSRVETQIPVKLTMYNLPQGVRRLHLPRHTMSKAKLFAKAPDEQKRCPDMLELYTMLVCTSAMQDDEKRSSAFARAAAASHPTSSDVGPEGEKAQEGGEVRICDGCIAREKKRAGRKKNKKPEEEELWEKYRHHRAIVFNTNEVKEWQHVHDPSGVGMPELFPKNTVLVEAPMRIACYCRHHGEKLGFQVIFTIKDFQDRVIVQEISSSIMITDDHKTHLSSNPTTSTTNSSENLSAPSAAAPLAEGKLNETSLAFRQTQSTSDLQSLTINSSQAFQQPSSNANSSQGTPATTTPRNSSRQSSPTTPAGPVSKKRKASGSTKVPTGLAMTRLETGQTSSAMPHNTHSDSAVVSAATSPFSPPLGNFPPTTSLYPQGQQSGLNTMPPSFVAPGPLTPNTNNNDQMLFSGANRNMSLDNLAQPMYSVPASGHPSRAPSPNHMRNDINVLQNAQLSQALYNAPITMNNASLVMNSARAPNPMIHKIIPGEGPKSGGIEVTILGSGFTNGGLEVIFGDQRATTTTFWGESSLVCLLPPSHVTGPVLVSIKQPRMPEQPSFSSKNQAIFRYVDDNEEQLMRTALAVLGHKVGGNIQDVADIARSIIQSRSNQGGWGPSSGSGGQPPGVYNQFEHGTGSLETRLLRVLELIDLDDSINKARINLRRSTGQTMLHLACALGMHRFAAGLLSRGANTGARDKGGFTPLHFAAMNDHSQIVRRLMISGADPTMRSLSGLTAADVAQSRDVLRALRRVENHSRSRSTGSLHSRVSSATSLKSLWDPPSMTANGQDFLSDASESQSDGDSYQDSSDEDEVDDGDWLDMKHPSLPRNRQLAEIVSTPAADATAGMASPSAAMTAFRDQFATQLQQFQQSIALLSQNWPQLQMPMLPDYHNYLHNAPVMQRIASLVPQIGGSRPGSAGDEQPRDGDKQRWEMPSFFGVKDAPPPAYEDIFPQEDIDTKQATAAMAAADYEADTKCAALYDEATSGSSTAREVPTLLQIGRKNAITREQREYLQRAHAERLKTGSSDKKLWFVWIPLLTFILGAMLFSGGPTFVTGTANVVRALAVFVAAPRQAFEDVFNHPITGRTAEIN